MAVMIDGESGESETRKMEYTRKGILYTTGEEEKLKWHIDTDKYGRYLTDKFYIKVFQKHGTTIKDAYFYIYNGKIYESVSLLTIENLGFRLLPDQFKDLYIKKIKNALVDVVINYGYIDKYLHEMEEDTEIIALNNCLYNWKTDMVSEFSPEYWITSILDYDYNANATSERFKNWLTSTLVDELGRPNVDKIKFIKQLMGYCFYREHPIKALFFIYGLPNTGKSRFFTILENIVNVDNVSSITMKQLIDNKHATIGLKDNMINTEPDLPVPNNNQLNLAVLKNFAGGGVDSISGEEKYKSMIRFKSYNKLLFGLNRIPSFVDTGGDVSSRIHILTFTKIFDESNPNTIPDVHKPIIENERSGIFNWAMDGLRELYEREFKSFSNRDEFKIDSIYIEAGNPIIEFINERLTKTGSITDKITLKDLYQSEFIPWGAESESIKISQWGRSRFYSEMMNQCDVIRPQNVPTLRGYVYTFDEVIGGMRDNQVSQVISIDELG